MSKSKDFLSALNRIVDAFDGTTGGNNNDDMLTALDNIADAIENGSHDGGGSTGGVMVVHATSHYDEEHDATYYTADKSFDEVVSFIENGGIPILIDAYDGNVAQLAAVDQSNPCDSILFQRIYIDDGIITKSEYEYFTDPALSIPNYIGYRAVEYSVSGGSGGGGRPT